MTDETESVKKQILATGNAEILLEENDFLIVKWIEPEVTYTMEVFMYGKTGMANNYPWSHKLSETQAFYFLENVNEAIEYFKSKHHYFHVEVNEIEYDEIDCIDEDGIKFKDGHWITYRECASNFSRINCESNSMCVGERDITSDPPYIEFYSTYAHDRILFDSKGIFSKRKNIKEFIKIQNMIIGFGYTTHDLS